MIPLPSTTPAQRAPLYEDVEALVTVGFLAHTVMVGGVQFALRSLGPGDIFLLKTRVECPNNGWEVWTIASSIWMVNGVPMVGQSHLTPTLAEKINALPKRARGILFSIVMGLFTRQSKAVDAAEAYCYESMSRFRWKSYGSHLAPTHSGIPNMEMLGTNYVQRMWAFFNEAEDERLRNEVYWEGLKLVVSTQSPKGVKKIDQRDKQLLQAEMERRQGILDRFFYLSKGIITQAQVAANEDISHLSLTTKSPEQLENEMRRWVAGEEDWHDKVVTEYKEKVTAQHEAEQRERQRRTEVLRERLSHEEVDTSRPTTALVGYTVEQLQGLLAEKGLGIPGARTIYTENKSRDFLYSKHLSKKPSAGLLESQSGHLAMKEGADLTEQVAGRAVPFSYSGEEEDGE